MINDSLDQNSRPSELFNNFILAATGDADTVSIHLHGEEYRMDFREATDLVNAIAFHIADESRKRAEAKAKTDYFAGRAER